MATRQPSRCDPLRGSQVPGTAWMACILVEPLGHRRMQDAGRMAEVHWKGKQTWKTGARFHPGALGCFMEEVSHGETGGDRWRWGKGSLGGGNVESSTPSWKVLEEDEDREERTRTERNNQRHLSPSRFSSGVLSRASLRDLGTA